MNIITPSFRTKIIEGRNKIFFQNDTKGQFDLFFKEEDDKSSIGIYRKVISEELFILLSECGINNHFLTSIGIREQKVMALDILPFSFTVYSFVSEDLSKRFYLPVGMKLKDYLLEIHITNQFNNIVSKEHIINFGWLDEEYIDILMKDALRAMDIIYGYFKAINITVFSITFRFGKRYKNDGEDYDCLLADELSLKNINLRFNDLLNYDIEETYLKISEKILANSKL